MPVTTYDTTNAHIIHLNGFADGEGGVIVPPAVSGRNGVRLTSNGNYIELGGALEDNTVIDLNTKQLSLFKGIFSVGSSDSNVVTKVQLINTDLEILTAGRGVVLKDEVSNKSYRLTIINKFLSIKECQ